MHLFRFVKFRETALAFLARVFTAEQHVGRVLGVGAVSALGPLCAELVLILAAASGPAANVARFGAVDVHVVRILKNLISFINSETR